MDGQELEALRERFLREQNALKAQIRCEDTFAEEDLRTIAGVDLAYWEEEDGKEHAVCCLVVLDYRSGEVVEKRRASGAIEVPYMPGFLAFRELPLVRQAVEKLETKPDLYMFDGNGYLHPRHMGIASQASFFLDAPTIGVAKTYYRVEDGLDYEEPAPEAGSWTDIVLHGEVYGRALRTHKNVKPVFLSVGNRVSLDTATKITLKLVGKESHIPLPTRLADLETHIARKELRG